MNRENEESEGMPEDTFTIVEASHYVGATRWTLEKYHLRGELPAVRTVGGSLIFMRRDLDIVAPRIRENKVKFRSRDMPKSQKSEGGK
jgi:predicted site-specific integrase-resolvase